MTNDLRLRFGPFEADLAAGEVFHRGRRLPLQEKPFQILALLLRRPGQLVTRQEIAAQVWPNVFVQQDLSLNTAMRRLRAALEKADPLTEVIETVGRRGYRLRAEVKSLATVGASVPADTKLRLAVLPFTDLDDSVRDFFSDALTGGIINAVSKLRNVFVIGRYFTFTYKGRNVTVQQVAEEMGVQYVLEGNVQRIGGKVRVTAQLVDVHTHCQLMSERYDRVMKDIFVLQDEITMNVLTAMRVVLSEGEMVRVTAKGTKNLEAYLKVMQATQLRQVFNAPNLDMAKRLAEEAIALDPNYAMAYSVLGSALSSEVSIGQHKNTKEVLAKARNYSEKAVALDDSLGFAHSTLSWTLIMNREYDRAISEAQRGLDLEPGSAQASHNLGMCLSYSGQYEQAVPWLKRALLLSPAPKPTTLGTLGLAYRNLGQYQESIAAFKDATQSEPDYLPGHLGLAATYILAGKEPEARAETAEVIRINPNFSLEKYAKSHPMKNRSHLMNRYIEPLRKAGLK
jgi:TolB-like protein/Tfp pilus assembly protein PilF